MKKSSEPFAILEGMFCVVKSSPVSAESVVTWRVYEAYDFASPITYIVESVTARCSSTTRELRRDQSTKSQDHNNPRTSVPEQSMPKLNPHSSHQCGTPYGHWSRQTGPLPLDFPLSPSAPRKRHESQASSGCTVGRFPGGATSFHGLWCLRGSQAREVRNRLLQKASQRLKETPKVLSEVKYEIVCCPDPPFPLL